MNSLHLTARRGFPISLARATCFSDIIPAWWAWGMTGGVAYEGRPYNLQSGYNKVYIPQHTPKPNIF